MNTIESTMTTRVYFSDDNTKRYLIEKTWDPSLPNLAIVLLAPSSASTIQLDSTTSLVLNNAVRLGFGSVSIVNLFATLGNYTLTIEEGDDPENLKAIVDAAKKADVVVYAPGVGKTKVQMFQDRARQVLTALKPYEKKLKCLATASGKSKLLHPLCPSVRRWTWLDLPPIEELLSSTPPVEPTLQPKKKGRPTVTKKESSV